MTRRLISIAGLLGPLLCAAPLSAQPDESAEQQAATAFAAAERSFAESDYEAALKGFERAHALQRHDATLFNIAVCLERLARFKDAADAYTRAADSEQLGEHERQRARELSARMRARLAVVSLSGTPRGALVRVDGQPSCRLPCRLELDPGTHRLSVSAGTRQWNQRVELTRGGRVPIEVRLPPERSPLSVASPAAPARAQHGPTWLTWFGGGFAIAGGAAATYFGLRAQSLNDEYREQPSRDTLDSGKQHQFLANAFLGLAVAGAVVVALDLFVLERPVARPPAASLADRHPRRILHQRSAVIEPELLMAR